MKSTLNSFLIAFILTGIVQVTIAQKSKLSEGKIIFDITYPGTDLDQNMMAMMPSEVTCYIKKQMTREEMKSEMGSVIAISNSKDGSTVMLMDIMGSKMALKATKDDLAKEKANSGKPEVKITDETKEIAGYKCTKAIVTVNENNEKHTFNVWFTKDIEARNSSKHLIEGIDGFMMEFEMRQQGMNMKLTARSVEAQPVDDTLFIIPDGYKEMTMEDMLKMQQGMGK